MASSPAACRPLTLRAPRCSELCPPLVLGADLPSLSPSCLLTLLDPDLPKFLRASCQVLGKISFAQRQGLSLGLPPIFAVNRGLLHLTWRRVVWAETWLLWPPLPSPGSSGNFQCSLLGHWVSEVWLRGLSPPHPRGGCFYDLARNSRSGQEDPPELSLDVLETTLGRAGVAVGELQGHATAAPGPWECG